MQSDTKQDLAGKQQITLRRDYQPPAYLVDDLHLSFELDRHETVVVSRFVIRPNPEFPGPAPALRLHGEQLQLQSIQKDGRSLNADAYRLGKQALELDAISTAVELQIQVLLEPIANTALEGLYVSGDFLLTQCEAEGFRRITYFFDRPDVMCRYHVTMRAAGGQFPVLLSNGNLQSCERLPDGRRQVLWVDPLPKPSYLFALVAGDLACVEDQYVTADGRQVMLKFYIEHGSEGQVVHAMHSLHQAMRWDEQRFGLYYDLDVYHVVVTHDFNMGAMENKSLNIFNSRYVLADRETATDADYCAIEAVIGHEYFHNWTGNRVTCRDWFQLTLKEGLTVFRDQEFTSDMQSRAVKRIQDVRALREYQFAEDAGPLAHPIRPDAYQEINNFYTATVYQKGAEVIRMLHTMLGEEGFQRGMRLYFQRHDGRAVSCDDFIDAMAAANDYDLQQFKRWYEQAGTPRLRVELDFDEQQQQCRLHLTQLPPVIAGQSTRHPESQPGNQPGSQQHDCWLQIPVRLALFSADGHSLQPLLDPDTAANVTINVAGNAAGNAAGEILLLLSAQQQTIVCNNIDSRPVPSLLRGLSAPVKLEYDYSREQLACLLRHDDDAVNRYDAAERLQLLVLDDLYQARRSGRTAKVDPIYIDALTSVLSDRHSDPALLALLLTLVSEDYCGRQYKQVDIEHIHAARKQLATEVAGQLATAMRRRMCTEENTGAWSLSAQAMARRSLHNTLQGWLMFSTDSTVADEVYGRYRKADNMTDRLAALAQLVWHASRHASAALAEFAGRFKEYPLVLDKWFAVQAVRPHLPVSAVQELLEHPAYSARNPNKVRALLGSFSAANPTAFHAADGSAYRFMVEQIAAQDQLNPQLAASLARCFSRWRALDQGRQCILQTQLQQLLDRPDCSAALAEMLSRTLVGHAGS